MGKPSPTQPSTAAAVFAPETERQRVQNVQNQNAPSTWNIAVKKNVTEACPAAENGLGDSGQNSYSPNKQAQNAQTASQASQNRGAPPAANIFIPPHLNKINLGWDKLLVTQKNICKKAINLLSLMEAPKRYFASARAKVSDRKHQGVILDYHSDDDSVIVAKDKKAA